MSCQRHLAIQKTHLAITAPDSDKAFLFPSGKCRESSIGEKVEGATKASLHRY